MVQSGASDRERGDVTENEALDDRWMLCGMCMESSGVRLGRSAVR